MCKCSYKSPDGKPCQFVEDNIFTTKLTQKIENEIKGAFLPGSYKITYQFNAENTEFCIFHLPLENKKEWSNDKKNIFYRAYELTRRTYNNFTGTQFVKAVQPSNNVTFPYSIGLNRNPPQNAYFNHCDFENETKISGWGKSENIPLTHSTFHGTTIFEGDFYNLDLSHCNFSGPTYFTSGRTISNSTFNYATFEGIAYFSGNTFCGTTSFTNTTFKTKANFDDCRFGQDTDFTFTKFENSSISPETEASFRTIRKAMSENRNHQFEGKFYALEQKCNRQRFSFWNPIKTFSCLYDWLSEYGTNPGRAGLFLLGIQLPFYAIYSKLLCNQALKPLSFTFAQVFKPFDIFSYKSMSYQPIEKAVQHSPSLPYISAFHSILTISIFAIFLLALRWRFRKG